MHVHGQNMNLGNRRRGRISIKEVSTAEELKQAQAIRVEVLEAEQGFPHHVNIDGLDESADHVLILDDGVPVATARLTETDPGEGTIARIAILESHRGRGLGKRLIRRLEDAAKRHGLHIIRLKPHAHLEQFFQALGYERVADPVTVGQHRLLGMVKKL